MFKKCFRCVLYFFAGLNLGVVSGFFPAFLAPMFLITQKFNVSLGVSAVLCTGIVALLYWLHYKNVKEQHCNPDGRVTAAAAGFVIGAVLLLVYLVVSGTQGPEGIITGN